MEEQDRLSLLEYYVGEYILVAKFSLKDNKPEQAEAGRKDLIKKLKTIEPTSLIERCLGYLKQTTWENIEGINSFEEKYSALNLPIGDTRKLVFRMF